jgi:hypothetical protein
MSALNTETTLLVQAHREAITSPIDEIANELQELLSVRLAAYIAGVKSGKTIKRWASGDEGIRQESEQRLRTAYEIVRLLSPLDSPRIIKAWFIGMNPQLDDIAPAEAIREGRFREAINAAKSFVVSG